MLHSKVVCRWLLIGIFASVLAACGGSSSSSSNNGGGDDGGVVRCFSEQSSQRLGAGRASSAA